MLHGGRYCKKFFIVSLENIIMKVEIPNYILKSLIRHFERITENCKPSPSDIKTCEALRLGKKDIVKLKKIVDKST